MPTLSELITEQKQRRGFSYADLENRADSAIRRQRWQQLGTGVRIKEFPEPATIEAMAKALDVDVAVVVLAAARSIGLDVKRGAQSDLAAMLPYSANKLTADQRAAIVALVRAITEDAAAKPITSAQFGSGKTRSFLHQWVANSVRIVKDGTVEADEPIPIHASDESEAVNVLRDRLASQGLDVEIQSGAHPIIDLVVYYPDHTSLFEIRGEDEIDDGIAELEHLANSYIENEAAARRGAGASKGEFFRDAMDAAGEESQDSGDE